MSAHWPMQVTVGSFVADYSAPGEKRVVTEVIGWGAPPARLEVEDRMQQDGGWDSTPFYSSRIVTVNGAVTASSHAAAQAIADELRGLSIRDVHEMTVTDDALGPRTSLVRIESGADPEWGGDQFFRYTLQLRAPDPLLYGPPVFSQTGLSSVSGGSGLTFPLSFPLDFGVAPGTTPGQVQVDNAGTASYFPRLRVDGPVTNPVVTLAETGDRIAYSGTVAAGQWLDVDLARRRVLINGQVSMRHRVSFVGAWLAVPVGGGTLVWSADDSDPAAVLSVWSYEGAWL